ncbi:unnamed protein product [Ectocarpus sp. 12 AP-2014]
MFGPRLTRVFASRNNALWWSAMVLMTAYCVAAEPPAAPVSATHEEVGAGKTAEKAADSWAGMKDVARKREELLP